ncbi:hypothetical protein Tco_1529709, partial [Tanacetum coccineum]
LVDVPIQVFIARGVNKGQEVCPFCKPQPRKWRIMKQHFNSRIQIDIDRFMLATLLKDQAIIVMLTRSSPR